MRSREEGLLIGLCVGEHLDDKQGYLIRDTIEFDRSKESESLLVNQPAILSINSALVHLKEGNYIQEHLERRITERNTPIGIIANKFGTTAWQLGTLGLIK